MLKGEFFKKYVQNARLVDDESGKIDDYREKVRVEFEGCIERVKLADAPSVYGFDKKYSVKNVYPHVAKSWNKNNRNNPEDVFFKADEFVILDIEKSEKIINLLDCDLENVQDLSVLIRTTYNFKDYNYLVKRIKESNTKTFATELISRYVDVVAYFENIKKNKKENVAKLEGDIILSFSNGEFKEFLKSQKIGSYSKAGYLVSTFKEMFNLIGVDVSISAEDMKIDGDKKIYLKKKDLISLCDSCDNVQFAYILYATFLGLGDKQFDALRHLTIDDIDKENLTITWGDKIIPIDLEFLEIAEECDKLLEYEDFFEETDTKRKCFLNAKSKYILKPERRMNNDDGLSPMASITIRNILTKLSEHFYGDRRMNKTYLHRSGALHNMYLIEKKTGEEWSSYKLIQNKNTNIIPYTFSVRDMIDAYELNYK